MRSNRVSYSILLYLEPDISKASTMALTRSSLNAARQEPETPLSHHCSLLFIWKTSSPPRCLTLAGAFIKAQQIEKTEQLIRVC